MPLIHKKRVLHAVHPNCGVEAAYRRKLVKLINEMNNSVLYWLSATYKANEPIIVAIDELPASALRVSVRKMVRQWQRRFNEAAPELAAYFALEAAQRSDASLTAILRKGGFSVRFKMTRAQQDIFHATVAANVALIKSIPQQYLQSVEGAVMRSVQQGRNLADLSREIKSSYGATKRRAAHIALDQNNKATGSLVRARQLELGIEQAVWMHSGAGKEPRPTHVAMNGKLYDIKKGMWDSHEKEWIHPGFLINCRCFSRPVIEGFS